MDTIPETETDSTPRCTEGDWIAEDGSPLRIVAHHTPASEKPPVILATMHVGGAPPAEVRANAAVMAQAKELATACQFLLSIYDEAERGGDGGLGHGPPDWYDRNAVEYLVGEARAILFKAQGRWEGGVA